LAKPERSIQLMQAKGIAGQKPVKSAIGAGSKGPGMKPSIKPQQTGQI
jgi:hypothetical protein